MVLVYCIFMAMSADPKSIKALAFDLDGTLLAPGAVLTDRTIKAVKGCIGRGIRIIISTGRAVEAVERFRQPLGADGPMVYFNGAIVADMPAGAVLSSTLLDKTSADFCVELSRETGAYCQLYLPVGGSSRTVLMAEWDGPERQMYFEHTGLLSELGDLKETLRQYPDGCIKAAFLAEPDAQAGLRPKLAERLGKSVYVTNTMRTFLEIMDAGASKGRGLQFAMEHLSLKSEEVIAFGDDENDIPMFSAAGFSVAPGNAKEAVKAHVDLVVGPNTEDGVAVFLEDFFSL